MKVCYCHFIFHLPLKHLKHAFLFSIQWFKKTNKQKTCLKHRPHFIILSFKTHFHCFCCEDKLGTLKKEDKSPKLKYSSEKQIIFHSLHTCNTLQLKSTHLTAGMLVFHSSGPVNKMSWKDSAGHLFGHFITSQSYFFVNL